MFKYDWGMENIDALCENLVNFDNGYPNQWLLVESSEIVVWVAKFKWFCEWAKSVESLTQALVEL